MEHKGVEEAREGRVVVGRLYDLLPAFRVYGSGLGLTHTEEHVARAVKEGMGLYRRSNLGQVYRLDTTHLFRFVESRHRAVLGV